MFKRLRPHQHTIGHWAMELLVVFVGVLIALSAQAWAQDRSAKARAEAAETRIREELGTNIFLGYERIALRTCLKERLADLASDLGSGRTDWGTMRMAPADGDDRMAFDRLYRTPSRPWVSTEYEGSIASGALDTLSSERTSLLAASYNQIERMRELNAEEEQLANRLAALQFGTPLSGPERNELLATLTRLDYLNGVMVLVATQNAEHFRDLYSLTPEEVGLVREHWDFEARRMRSIYGNCANPRVVRTLDQRLSPPDN